MKILSPAGEMESLKQAVYNGADEVYLGVKDFNARNIEGFNLETLKEAVKFAHIFGVRVFLTVNILFRTDEIQNALNLIVEAYNIGVDAFIIQDIGLANLVHLNYPQIEMHASTQMGIHNLEGVKFIEKFGFKRVCLSRETPLKEIKRIHEKSNIEIEYFVQGALCVSFSGNCYMSSYMFENSGNRGKCKQLCRLPYDFKFGDKTIKSGYLLSAKDFNMINRLKDLEDAGVVSLKIEGRARRPFYVGTATKIYKAALNNQKYNLEELSLAFTRGYTEGYFNGNNNIISNIQNHFGIEIGKVVGFKTNKKFNEIEIETTKKISPKSTLKFFRSGKEVATISAYDVKLKNGKTFVTTTNHVKIGDKVNLISDNEKEENLLKFIKKRIISGKIIAKIGEKIKFFNNSLNLIIEGEVLENAKNNPLTKDELALNFKKNEFFDFELDFEIEDCFILKSKLNEFRRKVVDELISVLTNLNREKLETTELENNEEIELLKDFEMLDEVKVSNSGIAIYNPQEFTKENVQNFIEQNRNKKCYLNLPIFALSEDIEMLKTIVNETKIGVVANNYYALDFDVDKIIGGGLNVYNSYAYEVYKLPVIMAEGGNFKMPYMTLRHCPMKEHLNANCKNCPYKNGYYYEMQSGKKFRLRRIKMSTCTFELVD